MSANTSISWTHHTHNPWSGCAKISAGCTNCYAANLPPAMRRYAVWGPTGTRIRASESYLREPFRWDVKAQREGTRHRVFCASVADVFEDRDDLNPWREDLWEMIAATPFLDWQLLTKRPHVAARWAESHPWPVNAWIGTSVEDQAAADERIPHLLKIPARVRFLSMEPLLGKVDLSDWLDPGYESGGPQGWVGTATGIRWVIAGGESGHKARPMHPDWARSIRDQCVAARVSFHFKQWGEWAENDRGSEQDMGTHRWLDGVMSYRVGKHIAGRILDGRTWDQLPEALS